MISVSLAQGSGSPPKNINKGSTCILDASDYNGDSFLWECASSPPNAKPVFSDINQQITRFGPLNEYGVYCIYFWVDKDTVNQKLVSVSLHVPESNLGVVSSFPSYKKGSPIRNPSFELPGILPGYAFAWDLVDDAGIINNNGGIFRGRCMPINFSSDGYAMVLGDDTQASETFDVGDEFSISQEVDFTDIKMLTLTLKLSV